MKLESTLKTDSSGVDYFAPCKNAYDIRELKDEESGRLLQAVAQLKEYEAIAIVLLAGIRGRLDEEAIPAPFRGAPIVLLCAALMSIAFMGFSGL